MPPDDPPTLPVSLAAPRRARPLTPTPHSPAPPDRAAIAALALAQATAKSSSGSALPPAAKPPAIEARIAAAGQDADQILRTLETEMALRRAGRSIKGDDQVKALRVLSVAMLFTLLIAALGAMSYVQMQFTGHGFKHRAESPSPSAASASPAPGPSTPAAASARQSVPPTR